MPSQVAASITNNGASGNDPNVMAAIRKANDPAALPGCRRIALAKHDQLGLGLAVVDIKQRQADWQFETPRSYAARVEV